MPHPEHATEKLLGGEDGLKLFQSVVAGARRGRRNDAPPSVAPGH